MQVTEAGLIRYNGKLKVNSTICKWYKWFYLLLIDTSTPEHDITFPALTTYSPKDEVVYSYSKDLNPFKFLSQYGITLEENPFAELNVATTNYFKRFSNKQRDICSAIGCIDTTIH